MKPLSFVIITYNRPADTLELLQNISRLRGASELLQDVIVVNNASDDDYSLAKSFINSTPQIPFAFIDAPKKFGCYERKKFCAAICEGRHYYFFG